MPEPTGASSNRSPLDRVVTAVRERAGERDEVAAAFARAALRRVPTAQLARVDARVAADWLVDAFEWFLASLDEPGQSIRVLTPDVGLDGRSDPGTVLEIMGDDRPFLLATITRTIEDTGAGIVRTLHPIVGTERDADGRLVRLTAARQATHRESFVHVELDTRLTPDEQENLRERLRLGLQDVMRATEDHHGMRSTVEHLARRLRTSPPPGTDHADADEAAALLEWLLDDNFILLGWREYAVERPDEGEPLVRAVPDTALGILRDVSSSRYEHPQPVSSIPEQQRERLLDGPLLRVSRSNARSRVHRLRRMEYIGVLWRDDRGRVTHEYRLLGLFTSAGMTEPARSTPVLRRRLREILEREDVVPGSHDETMMVSLFQSLPKDELFQTDLDDLHETLVALLEAEELGRTRVMVRIDEFTRTVSVVLAVPKDDYSARVRHRVTELLLQRYGAARVEVDLALGDRSDAVARFTVHVEGPVPDVSPTSLERDIHALVRPWSDQLRQRLVEDFGEADGQRMLRTLGQRLPTSYREAVTPEVARDDLIRLELLASGRETIAVWLQRLADGLHVKAARRGAQLELSAFIPILESLGLRVLGELPHELEDAGPAIVLHDFIVAPVGEQEPMTDTALAAETIVACAHGEAETDSLNTLVVRAGLTWEQVALLRAYRRYRRQIGTAYTTEYANEALVGNPTAAGRIIDYFEARFDPDRPDDPDAEQAARTAALSACDAIERLDHDRIVRDIVDLVDATVRTNAYRLDRTATDAEGRDVRYLALKFDSSRVAGIPRPIPYREIFVHSPAVEGVHLRGGAVARGGLRWSDRRDDVRTEVLGLMKAQVVKNSLIVPTGAKGGFVLKRPPTAPEELRVDVQRQYVTFIQALLDVTDNIVHGEIVPPERVRRHDGDDPYLVVAADKGTATFSDVANAVAEERGFWLDDAFASGGSKGYDHKRLGITARGAWVAITRHFRELGIDIQDDPVTVAGIGDMSGDVFGNGMLLSKSLRLVAAFDHRDIFLDPDPDPETAYAERQRLFGLPRSSWQDYDPDAISAGGGVWSRSEKRIELSDQVREVLRIDDAVLSPPELVQAILRAPVDLLYAGGIGTYVKASTETHADVGDRTNDDLRIDATELRARVFGEGANLSITQRGRIQYARRGGRVDQDAVHNAAGVDISDHEVNLKILLGAAEEQGTIDREERDRLLVEVTDDVVDHVLSDVDRQTWQLSQQAARGGDGLPELRATIAELVQLGMLQRRVDVLPDEEELDERAAVGAGLTRPELATVVAAAKRALTADVTSSRLPEDATVMATLASYFPRLLVERFSDEIAGHRLRRELIATIVANDLVNMMGPSFAFRLSAETGRDRREILAAYWAARTVADAARWWDALDGLGEVLPPERQLHLKQEVDGLVETLTRTYLDDPLVPDVAGIMSRDREVFAVARTALPNLGTARQVQHRRQRAQRLIDDLIDPDLADVVVGAEELGLVPEAAVLARATGGDTGDEVIATIVDTMLRLSTELGVDRLDAAIERSVDEGVWADRQRVGLEHDLRRLLREAVSAGVTLGGGLDDAARALVRAAAPRLAHVRQVITEVDALEEPTLDAVAVAVRALIGAVESAA